MADTGQEKTEQATPKRLEEARKKGQVPRSVDLSTAAVCIAAAVAIYLLGGMAAGQFADFMKASFIIEPARTMNPEAMWPQLTSAGALSILIVLPILAAAAAIYLLGGMAAGQFADFMK